MKSQDAGKYASWIEIAREGRFKDSSGRDQNFDKARLVKIAKSYNPEKREAPLVVGHPSTNAPAYGWVRGVKIFGEKLLANVACVTAEIKQAVDNGFYKYVSMSLYPDDGLRHVGLLGAAPPAIDGLAPVSFSDDDAITINFSTGPEPEAEGGQMKTIEELMKEVATLEAQMATLKRELAEAERAKAEAETRTAEVQAASEKTAAEFAAYRDAREKAEVARRIDSLIESGKIMPAEREATEKTAEALRRATRASDFSQSDDYPLETYLGALEKREPSALLTNFSAPADGGGQGIEYKSLTNKL